MNRAEELQRMQFKAMQRGFIAGYKAGQRVKGGHEPPRRWLSAWAFYLRSIHLLPGRHAPH